MDMVLNRSMCGASGLFSYLEDESGNQIAVTAEHAYQGSDGTWAPKVPDGKYLCQRGVHQLSVGLPFETFEVTQVPGHTGILFHKGNLPEVDSEGCLLLGTAFGELTGIEAVLGSADAFNKFMELQNGVDQFWLTVQ